MIVGNNRYSLRTKINKRFRRARIRVVDSDTMIAPRIQAIVSDGDWLKLRFVHDINASSQHIELSKRQHLGQVNFGRRADGSRPLQRSEHSILVITE